MLLDALHRKGNLFPRLIHRQHPDTDDVADLYDVERMLHKSIRKLRDMDESILVHTDIDECAEIYDISNGPLKLHLWLQIIEIEHI